MDWMMREVVEVRMKLTIGHCVPPLLVVPSFLDEEEEEDAVVMAVVVVAVPSYMISSNVSSMSKISKSAPNKSANAALLLLLLILLLLPFPSSSLWIDPGIPGTVREKVEKSQGYTSLIISIAAQQAREVIIYAHSWISLLTWNDRFRQTILTIPTVLISSPFSSNDRHDSRGITIRLSCIHTRRRREIVQSPNIVFSLLAYRLQRSLKG